MNYFEKNNILSQLLLGELQPTESHIKSWSLTEGSIIDAICGYAKIILTAEQISIIYCAQGVENHYIRQSVGRLVDSMMSWTSAGLAHLWSFTLWRLIGCQLHWLGKHLSDYESIPVSVSVWALPGMINEEGGKLQCGQHHPKFWELGWTKRRKSKKPSTVDILILFLAAFFHTITIILSLWKFWAKYVTLLTCSLVQFLTATES